MGINEVSQLIGALGFPIVACAAMFWDNRETRKSHKEEMDAVTKALANNTLVLAELKGVLDK